MSKMGKPDRRKLIKSLDTEVSRIVRQRHPFCVQCGTSERLTCGHLITQGKYSTRWDIGNGDTPGNCFCQCQGCNMKHEYQPEHFTLWFIREYGRDEYENLVARSNKLKKWTNAELTDLLTQLKEGQ